MLTRLRALALISIVAAFTQSADSAEPLSYEHSTRLSPSDYLIAPRQDHYDPVFDSGRTIELGVDLGIGSDCGKVDFHNTLRSSLRSMLDSKYFGDLGRDIVAGSPMLLACYFSPTWCAILKHSQLSANFLSQMRLNQCAIIDKYTDSRSEDFYRERQACVRERIKDKGGDLESAMDACQDVWGYDLTNWASGAGSKVGTNHLIESSAEWAGFKGEEAQRSVDLLKSLVGDTVVSRGTVSVDFGSKGQAATPATHLAEVRRRMQKSLCDDLLAKVKEAPTGQAIDQLVTARDLKDLSGPAETPLIDRQTIESLSYMPKRQRDLACRRLADAMGTTVFTKDVGRSLDILTAAAQNPNLPPNRRAEIEQKRQVLKESVDLALTLSKEREEPIDQIAGQINAAGGRRMDEAAGRAVQDDISEQTSHSARLNLMDCADGVMCDGRP